MSRIVLVSQSLRRGGAERVISNLSHELTRQGYKVYIILFQNEIAYDYSGELICINSSPSKSLIKKSFELISRVVKLRLIFSKLKPSKIIAFTESANFPTIMTLKSCVVSIRNNPNEKLNRWQKVFIRIFYRFPNVRKVVAVSKNIEKLLNSDYKLKNTIAIINGIDRKFIDGQSMLRPKDFTLLEHKYLLAVGRLNAQKGYYDLITSYSKSEFSGIMPLVILGDGVLRDELALLCRELDVLDSVIFKGAVENPFYYMRHSFVYFMSSKFEGFPNALLESMACGACCFSTDCPTGPNELIDSGINGYLFENSSLGINSMFDKLINIDEKEINNLKANALIKVDSFDINRIANRWMSI